MKRIVYVFLASLMILANGSGANAFWGESSSDSPWDQKLPFKEGTITYRVTGTESGSQITYVKDYGRTIAKYRDTAIKMFGISQSQQTIQITTPDFIYDIDVNQGSGTKTANPQKFMIEEYAKLSSSDKKKASENAKKMGTQSINGNTVKVLPCTDKILGYKCDETSVSGGKSYTFHGTAVELKSDFSTMGMQMITEVTNVSEGAVSDDKFLPPHGITVDYDRSSEDMMRNMARTTVANLVEGKQLTMPMASQDSSQSGQGAVPVAAPPAQENTGAGDMEQNIQEMMKGLGGFFGK